MTLSERTVDLLCALAMSAMVLAALWLGGFSEPVL